MTSPAERPAHPLKVPPHGWEKATSPAAQDAGDLVAQDIENVTPREPQRAPPNTGHVVLSPITQKQPLNRPSQSAFVPNASLPNAAPDPHPGPNSIPNPPPLPPKTEVPAPVITDRRDSEAPKNRGWFVRKSTSRFASRMMSFFGQESAYVERARQEQEPVPDPVVSGLQPDARKPSGVGGKGVSDEYLRRRSMFSKFKSGSVKLDTWKERLQYTFSETFLFYPDSRFLYYWDSFIGLLIVYTILLVPYVISFNVILTGGWMAFDVFVDFMFLANIFFVFRTVIIDKYEPVTDTTEIARIYLKRWFIFDLVSSIPISLFVNSVSIGHPLQLPRLLRLSRFIRVERKNTWSSASHMLTVTKLTMEFFMFSHWLGCAWYFVGRIQHFPDNSFSPGPIVQEKSPVEKYLQTLAWGFINLAGLGGNLIPKTKAECSLTIMVVIVSLFVFASIIGSMNSAISTLDRTKDRFRERLQGINEYMRYRRLPDTTQLKIKQHYEKLWSLNQGLDEMEILEGLPRDLRIEVATFVHKHILQKVPLFKDVEETFIRALALRIRSEICLPGGFIFRQGERGAEMYFLNRGRVEVIGGDGVTILTELGEGAYFGEIAILTNTTRTASVRAKEACELFVLQKKDFDGLLDLYPTVAKKIRAVAEEREKNKGSVATASKAVTAFMGTLKDIKNRRQSNLAKSTPTPANASQNESSTPAKVSPPDGSDKHEK